MKRLLAAACVTILSAFLLVTATPASASTITVNPTADAYVSKFSPTSNFGTANPLEALGAPASKERFSYLKFNVAVPAGETVTGVTLKLYLGKLPVGSMFVNATGSAWAENTINWNNDPGPGVELARLPVPTVTGYTSITLPASSVVSGDNSFTIQETNSTTNLQFYSREDATRKPQLVVTTTASAQPPVASFTANPTSGTAPLAVQFTDTSTGMPTSWAWTFGDGGTSTSQNPAHTYSAAGTYSVTLTATNAGGSSSSSTTITVNAPPPPAPPIASFTAVPTSGTVPLAVQFTDTSTGSPATWGWDFGDGGTSTAQNPSHTYAAAGTYIATLTASNAGGFSTASTTITVNTAPPPSPPVASFTATPTSGVAPLAVTFTDTSTGSPTGWAWDFGDTGTSTAQNPSHTYTTAGTYTVMLTASNAGGSSTATQTVTVTAPPPSDLLTRKDLLYSGEVGEWREAALAINNTAVQQKMVESGSPMVRFAIDDCFVGMTCGRDNHAGTRSVTEFRQAIQVITQTTGKQLWFKMIPIAKDVPNNNGNTFCPPWTGDASGNLPFEKRILDEIKNAGYLGPLVIETNNEEEYTCWEYWKSQGAPITGSGSIGVSKRIGEHYAATGPALKAYAQGLGFSQVVVGGYIGVSGGPQWGQACTADATKPFGYNCGYQSRWITEFNDAVIAAGAAPPDFESIHSYNHGDDFANAPWTFDNNITYAYYRNWITQTRSILRTKWGTTAGDNIRLSMSEWNAGEDNSGGSWSGWTTPGQPGAFYDGWYGMLRGDGNMAGGTRYWEASLFCIACNSDANPGKFYNVIRQAGTVPDWYYNWKTAALSGL